MENASTSRLRTNILGLELDNPVLIGSGLITDSPSQIRAAFAGGAGGVVTKTIFVGRDEQQAEKVSYLSTGALNSTTYSRRTIESWENALSQFFSERLPVIASIFSDTPQQLATLAERLAATGCEAFELGICCPNDGSQQRLTPDLVEQYVSAARRVLRVPFAVKLTATGDYLAQVRAAVAAGADAISLSDTLPAVSVDLESRSIAFGGPVGYSGPGIKPLVLHAIYQLRHAAIRCPIMGIGGVSNALDALEYLQLGCACVQVYTLPMTHGLASIAPLVEDLNRWCIDHETTTSGLVGAALA